MEEKDKDQDKEGGFYVVQAVEISSESEPEDVENLSDID